MPGERTSVYLAADLAAAVKASGIPLAELIRRGLAATEIRHGVTDFTDQKRHAGAGSGAEIRRSPDGFPLAAISDGEPSPGALCMGPGCLERNTRRFGLRRLPLCPACAAALEGRTYQREVPESAARAIRRGAA